MKHQKQYKIINIDQWNRREHFESFSNIQCGFTVTVEIDITSALSVIKKQQYQFYPTMIYLITRAVNQLPAFKMGMKDGELIEWGLLHPSYTIFHPESETFSALWTTYHSDITKFMANYLEDFTIYQDDLRFLPKPNMPENTFDISCLPWLSFTGFTLSFPKVDNHFKPIMTMGKYREKAGIVSLPMAIQVHHAVCDGFHVAKFVETLQKLCDDPSVMDR